MNHSLQSTPVYKFAAQVVDWRRKDKTHLRPPSVINPDCSTASSDSGKPWIWSSCSANTSPTCQRPLALWDEGTESQTMGQMELEGSSGHHRGQSHCSEEYQPGQLAESCAYSGLEYLHGWRLHNPLDNPFQFFTTLKIKKSTFHVSAMFPISQFFPIASCLFMDTPE